MTLLVTVIAWQQLVEDDQLRYENEPHISPETV